MANFDASKTSRSGAAVVTANRVTLSASDTFTYVAGTGQILELHNNTAGSLTAVIKGSAPTTVAIPGAGGATLDVSGGLSLVVAASQSKFVNLDAHSAYLVGNGTITVT